MGEPLGDFSSLVTLEVCRLAKEKMTVVLSGNGGDELFWGYQRFRRITQAQAFFSKPWIIRLWKWLIHKFTKSPISLEWLKYADFGNHYLKVQGQLGADSWAPRLVQDPWNPPLLSAVKGLNFKPKQVEEAAQLARDLEKRIHLQRVLLKVDRASMFHSVEVRTPLLSRPVEMANESFTFHECMDVSGMGKLPLRALVQKITGLKEVSGAAKRGFTLPLDQWLRKDLKESIEKRIKAIPPRLQPFFKPEAIEQMWNEHQAGKNHSWMIWNLYSLFEWTNQHLKEI